MPCSRMITHAEMLFLCTSSPQQRGFTTSIRTSLWAAAGSRGKEGKLPYVFTSCEVPQLVVPLRGRMQTLSRVRNPSAVTLSTGGTRTHFHPLLRTRRGHGETLSKSDPVTRPDRR